MDTIQGNTQGLKVTIVVTAIAAVAAVVGIISWGGQMFGVGMDAGILNERVIQSVDERMNPRIDELNFRSDRIEIQVERLINAIEEERAGTPSP